MQESIALQKFGPITEARIDLKPLTIVAGSLGAGGMSKQSSHEFWLQAIGAPKHCIERKASVRENGVSFSIKPNKGDDFIRIKVDGCWIKDARSKRIDYLFWINTEQKRKNIVLVELKGTRIKKALEQMECTLGRLCKFPSGKVVNGFDALIKDR